MSSADLFKKFTLQNVAQIANITNKEQAQVRKDLAEQYPLLADYWEDIIPKKSDIMLVRCHDQVHCVTLVSAQPEVLFFNHHGGPYIPHLKLLQKYPFILPKHQVDIGACKYVVSGANIMCPGLTSKGGYISPDIAAGQVVAVYVEGKEHAVAIGKMLMPSEEIERVNSGPCIENVHHLGDGLWMNRILSASHIGAK
ncbi:cytoplasmic translation machinery associated protein [Trypanosoma grayi]|uniref:cytoplasmic translation machinery associated protein n=1 Tax=Trypanosoma grayi TaxID=71804 RepID=UPI0004F4A763|nr:cytoplasmic translation machinery associated protein [Trypanosoma grayi]KEG08243.1 cytoplasmic translation machinery associated protein [Trypanosoma grayi]